jgi:hypothetical protein
MASLYQALDLKNEIEKFKYHLIEKYLNKSLFKSVILNTLNIDLQRLYLDEFIYKIRFIDYNECYTIKVYFRDINDFDIECDKISNDKIISDIMDEIKEYLNKLFKLNYRMKF